MKTLRTDEARFVNLPGYDFSPNYVDLDNVRMHYVDEGENDEEVVLLLHGEPSWSFLYRKMIPVIIGAGFRAIAPDLIGFGKSDKPVSSADYSYDRHLKWLAQFITSLNLKNMTLVCQDWGGLLGLRNVVTMPDRYKRIVTANTMLPTGQTKPNEAFSQWVAFSQNVPEFPVGKIIDMATVNKLTPEVMAAYDAPYPDESYKTGARIFPKLVPIDKNDPEAKENLKAWKVLKSWHKPFLTAFSDCDPIMSGLERYFQEEIPGAKGQNHHIVKGGGHFLQEDKGEELAEIVVNFIKNTD